MRSKGQGEFLCPIHIENNCKLAHNITGLSETRVPEEEWKQFASQAPLHNICNYPQIALGGQQLYEQQFLWTKENFFLYTTFFV